MKTNDERFEAWWDNVAKLEDWYGLPSPKDAARAAVNALCLSDEDRERVLRAIRLAECACYEMGEPDVADTYAAVRRRLEVIHADEH